MALGPEILKHERKAWIPKVKPGDGAPTASKFSGVPALKPGESWPACAACGKPLQLFVQLNLSTLPAAYGTGLLQLFYCTSTEPSCDVDEEGWRPFSKIHLVRRIDVPSAPAKASPPPGHFPASTIVGWEEKPDLPNWEELGELGVEVSDEDGEELEDRTVAGDKLGGWPFWVQGIEYPDCPQCRAKMRLVFQVDSEDHVPYMFGDAGCGHLTQCPTHPDVVAFGWACG